MLAFFRRFINSRVGVVVTLGVLAVIAIAFAAGDVTGLRAGDTGVLGGNGIAKVGKTSITAADLRGRADTEMQAFRQRQPGLTLAQYVQGGGLDATLDRAVAALALEDFGHRAGMVASKRLVDGQIASIPGLQGLNGQFDPQLYQRVLAERRLTDRQVRGDIQRDLIGQQLIGPTLGSSQVPRGVAAPYASLMLEQRSGQIGFIPAAAMAVAAPPTPAEVQGFYRRNLARYSLPERRTARYALVSADAVKARSAPTEAEIAQAYAAQRARFQPRQTRSITQVVVADQAGANALTARVRGGATLAAAAQAAGLAPAALSDLDKAAYARTASPALADAAFAAGKGTLVGPLRSPLGWTVARIEAITEVPGKSLAEARTELTDELTRQKTQRALADIHDAIDDALAKNATFDEVVADRKLQPVTSRALTAAGIDPAQPAPPADPALVPVMTAAFQADDGDGPQLVPVAADGSFALVALGGISPAAPRPFASVREAVVRDAAVDRAHAAARKVAAGVVAAVGKGTPLPQALAATGLRLPPIQPVSASRAEISRSPQGPPPPLALMFSVPQGTTRLLEAPGGAGWLIVKLDRVVPGNAAGNAGLLQAAGADLGRLNGREYVEQFVAAVKKQAGAKIDAAALAKLKADIVGGGAANN